MKILSFILSILGASAWIPYLIDYFKKHNRKIQAHVFDFSIYPNMQTANADYTQIQKGTIILLAVNLFIPLESYFVEEYEIKAYLKSGSVADAIILDGGFGSEPKEKFIKDEFNFNIHKGIINDTDNIRIIPIMLKEIDITDIDGIRQLNFTFKNCKRNKKLIITTEEFPIYNKNGFISKCLEER